MLQSAKMTQQATKEERLSAAFLGGLFSALFVRCLAGYALGGVALFALMGLLQPSAQAQRLKVTLGEMSLKRYQIAIPNFKALSGSGAAEGRQVAEILRRSLALCGVFRVIPPSSYLERAPRDGIETGEFDFEPWKNIGAEGVLKGGVIVAGGASRLKFRFYEIGSNKLALQKEYIFTNASQIRWYAHLFADELYKFMTSEKGIFTSKVSFIRDYSGKQEVWVMDVDGKDMKQLTNNGSINALPAWSPTGGMIAYTSWKDRNPDLYVYNLRTGKSKKISSLPGLNTGAAWSPDGRRIAFSASRGKSSMDIYTINADGTGLMQLTKAKWGERNLSPTWSPNGREIAFVSTRFSSPQIFKMGADGSNPQRLTTAGNYNQAPRWSPRGDFILFTGRDERNVFDLFLVSPTTREIKRLTQNQGSNIEATWSPNGRNVIFSSTRNGVPKLFIMTHEGKHPQQLTFAPGQFLTPSWSPSLAR
jgi:TolB protein